MRYRLLNGVRTAPYYITQGTWDYLRKGLDPQDGDVWITGYPGTGNILVQFMVRMLLSGGEAEAVTAARFERATGRWSSRARAATLPLRRRCRMPRSLCVAITPHAP